MKHPRKDIHRNICLNMIIPAFDAVVLYLVLRGDVDFMFSTLVVFILLQKLRKSSKSSFIRKIGRVLAMKMCVNFLLNDDVIANQRTIVFLISMQN